MDSQINEQNSILKKNNWIIFPRKIDSEHLFYFEDKSNLFRD